MTINFDMDGTIANLYGVDNWLIKLTNYDASPYENATPLINMQRLARRLNTLQKKGYEICIISWLSKNSTADYDRAVTSAKLNWLNKHLQSVKWDKINIVKYGTPKNQFKSGNSILFDDELNNRINWGSGSYTEKEIFEILNQLKNSTLLN